MSSRAPRLFDALTRDDPSPASFSEDSFTFLNRVDSIYWARVRAELESWFGRYPSEHAPDLRSRFRSADPTQHLPAWWELYLHELFGAAGLRVTVHPQLDQTNARPDFDVASQTCSFYCEAAVSFSGIVSNHDRHSAREAFVLDAINDVRHPDFFVRVNFTTVGESQPQRRQIIKPLATWLGGLDVDAAIAAYAADRDLPSTVIEARGWKIAIRAIPKRPEARGDPYHRLIGVGPATGGWSNTVERLRSTLARKRRHYGEFIKPYLIAVMTSSPVRDDEIFEALFGSEALVIDSRADDEGRVVRLPNGFFLGDEGHRATSVSGLLIGQVLPWT